MSRNKFILLVIIIAIVYVATPSTGTWQIIKLNFINLLPFIMAGIIIYLIITITCLKSAWKKLDSNVSDETTIKFAKIMNITFDVKRMLGSGNLIDLYNKVNLSPNASMNAKQLLYEAMRRKRLDVPLPGKGANVDIIRTKSTRSDAEIKAARIEASIQAKKKKKKK